MGKTISLMLTRTIFIIYALLVSHFSFGQVLSLEDIFKIHSLDSIFLKRFSVERNFRLMEIDEDDWALNYTFQSTENEKIYIQRSFPKGDAAMPFVRYRFDDQKLFKNFEDSIRARGFTRFKYHKFRGEIPTRTFVHDVSEYEIGLEKPKNGPSKYAITLTFSPQ